MMSRRNDLIEIFLLLVVSSRSQPRLRHNITYPHPPQCFDSVRLAQPCRDIFSKYIAQQRMSIGTKHQHQ